MLKLNDDKTEFIIIKKGFFHVTSICWGRCCFRWDFIIFGTRQQLVKMNAIGICIGHTSVEPIACIQNLSFFMEKYLTNAHHVNKLVSQLFYTLASNTRIHDKLDLESSKTIVQALVLSRLDYCNSPLAGSAQYQCDKLQCIENMAWRVVCRLKKFDHVTNSMESLHQLKV